MFNEKAKMNGTEPTIGFIGIDLKSNPQDKFGEILRKLSGMEKDIDIEAVNKAARKIDSDIMELLFPTNVLDIYEQTKPTGLDPIFDFKLLDAGPIFQLTYLRSNILYGDSLDVKNVLTLCKTKVDNVLMCSIIDILLEKEIYLHSVIVEDLTLASWHLEISKHAISINGFSVSKPQHLFILMGHLDKAKLRAEKICIKINL